MSAELALVHTAQVERFSNEKRALLRKTIAKDINDAEFELFEAVCLRTGLDPFAKQINAVKRGGKLCIDASIDGFRLTAARTKEYGGQEGPFWCGDDGTWKDVWLSKDPPAAAKVGVWRTGFKVPVWGIATFKSFAPYYNGRLGDMWQKMPDVMIAKCAESQALRKAFPAELSGFYTPDEMAQAENVPNIDIPGVDTSTGEIVDEEAMKAAAEAEATERAAAKAKKDAEAKQALTEFTERANELGYKGDIQALAVKMCHPERPLPSQLRKAINAHSPVWIAAIDELLEAPATLDMPPTAEETAAATSEQTAKAIAG